MTKKIKISFLIMVWGIVGLQMYVNYKVEEKETSNVVTAFSVENMGKKMEINKKKKIEKKIQEVIKGYGYLGKVELSNSTKKDMLKNLANKLEITSGYTIEEEKNKESVQMILLKKGKYADTKIEIVTIENSKERFSHPQQYIIFHIKTKEMLENTIPIYEKIKNIYHEIGVEGIVSFETTFEKEGNYTEEEKKMWMEEYLSLAEAEKIAEIKNKDLFTIYGYTKKEKQAYLKEKEKFNIQICTFYDEKQDKTYLKLGCPIVNSSY